MIFSASERIVDLLFALKAFRSGRPDQFPYECCQFTTFMIDHRVLRCSNRASTQRVGLHPSYRRDGFQGIKKLGDESPS
jgi:hypothetical protein